MTCDSRLLLLLALLMAYGLFVAECRYREDAGTDARHRHRHRHDAHSLAITRNHRDPAKRRAGWSQDLNYDQDSINEQDRSMDEADEEDEEDEGYESKSHYERPYSRSLRTNRRGRIMEPRYPQKSHRFGHHEWYDEDENDDRRRSSSRHASKSHHRFRSRHHRPAHFKSRNHFPDHFDDKEEYNYERSDKYNGNIDDGGEDGDDEYYDDDDDVENADDDNDDEYSDDQGERRHSPWWRNSKRHRDASWRRERRNKYDRRTARRSGYHNVDDPATNSWRFRQNDWRRKLNTSLESKYSRSDRGKETDSEFEDLFRLENDSREKDEEEDDIWKEAEDDNEEDEFVNDFYKSERKAPLKSYEDIIRRLTSDDPTTPRATVKRDYRNIETEKYPRHDSYSRNGSYRIFARDRSRISSAHGAGSSSISGSISSSISSGKPSENSAISSAIKSAISPISPILPIDRRAPKNAINVVAKGNVRGQQKKAVPKIDHGQPKTKSLEQDYEEYLNTGDNEKEEDLSKAGVEEDSGMQADVTNMDYTDDESTDTADETPAERFAAKTTRSATSSATSRMSSVATTTTTTSTSTTTTTTTTPRPAIVTPHYDYRDPRAYDSGTASQYTGYQSRNEYPPMSAHSVHKWQSLGTRESVKETRSHIQQYNKNGKSAEIREALQHAIKVSREGSCQWPRARVIPVRDVYPSPSTTYIPHCAILHRCSDDTGCCRSEALTCVPKHSHRVELSFYTTSVGGTSVVEKLSFYNHTECECRERTEYESTNDKSTEQRSYRHYHSPSSSSSTSATSYQPQNMRRAPAPPRKPCRCPSEFTPRITPEGECQCNCYENDQNCIKTRRGKGYFSLADRLCIQNDECATPNCEFGEYMRRQGKCPRKRDKFDAIANYHANLNHRYRS